MIKALFLLILLPSISLTMESNKDTEQKKIELVTSLRQIIRLRHQILLTLQLIKEIPDIATKDEINNKFYMVHYADRRISIKDILQASPEIISNMLDYHKNEKIIYEDLLHHINSIKTPLKYHQKDKIDLDDIAEIIGNLIIWKKLYMNCANMKSGKTEFNINNNANFFTLFTNDNSDIFSPLVGELSRIINDEINNKNVSKENKHIINYYLYFINYLTAFLEEKVSFLSGSNEKIKDYVKNYFIDEVESVVENEPLIDRKIEILQKNIATRQRLASHSEIYTQIKFKREIKRLQTQLNGLIKKQKNENNNLPIENRIKDRRQKSQQLIKKKSTKNKCKNKNKFRKNNNKKNLQTNGKKPEKHTNHRNIKNAEILSSKEIVKNNEISQDSLEENGSVESCKEENSNVEPWKVVKKKIRPKGSQGKLQKITRNRSIQPINDIENIKEDVSTINHSIDNINMGKFIDSQKTYAQVVSNLEKANKCYEKIKEQFEEIPIVKNVNENLLDSGNKIDYQKNDQSHSFKGQKITLNYDAQLMEQNQQLVEQYSSLVARVAELEGVLWSYKSGNLEATKEDQIKCLAEQVKNYKFTIRALEIELSKYKK